MGTNCISSPSKSNPDQSRRRGSLNNTDPSVEKKMLRLIYDDLATRSHTGKMSMKTFIEFYHLDGLWGEEIFRKFCKKNQSELEFEEFYSTIRKLAKGEKQEKIRCLFDFYDTDKNSSVSYTEFLKMVIPYKFYSYPKSDLQQILADPLFEKILDDPDQLSILRSSKNVPDRSSSESEPSIDDVLTVIQKSHRSSLEQKDIMIPENDEPLESKRSKDKLKSSRKTKSFSYSSQENVLHLSQKLISSPMNAIPRKNTKVTHLIRKYTEYLFRELGLTVRDSLNFQQFSKVIKKHTKIFTAYFKGFHNYLWDTHVRQPEFVFMKPEHEGQLLICYKDIRQTKFVKYMEDVLLIFNSRKDTYPEEVKLLKKLIIEELPNKRGFRITHKNGYYQQKLFCTETEEENDKWMEHLKIFQNFTVQEKYEVLDRIGAGTYSVVYRCRSKQDNKIYAMKNINKRKLPKKVCDELHMEVSIMEHCQHPYIINLVETFENKTHISIILEYLPDGDLFDYIAENNYLLEPEAAMISQQILQAIQYLNEQGLVHRDLKPENIMLSKKKRGSSLKIKLIDFGFAAYLDLLNNNKNIVITRYIGTEHYTAPEILTCTGFYDEKVDNYSIGVITFYMLTGELPPATCNFDDKESLGVKVPIWKSLSSEAKNFVCRLLKQNPKQRMSVKEALNHPWILTNNRMS